MSQQRRVLAPGDAAGPALRLDEPLSFWGGLEPSTGRIVDERHPQRGAEVAGRVLIMPTSRGSSSSSTVLAEAIRAGTGPSAIVLDLPDAVVALGALVARELYGIEVPVVVAPCHAATGDRVFVSAGADGSVQVGRAAH